MTDERFGRAIAFEREVLRRTSTLIESFAFGTAYLNDEFPKRYSCNLLWVDPGVHPSGADPLVAEADRILGGAGLAHRMVSVDGGDGRSLAPRFLELGWTVEHLVVMSRERAPDRGPTVPVVRTTFGPIRPVLAEVTRRWARDEDEEGIRQLVDYKRALELGAHARFFVAELDGRPAGVCELYSLGGTAQIEDVNTLEELRGRGAARAVVLAAVETARDEGAGLVFLVADHDDWPRQLYARLGFDPVGESWEFVRTPPA